MICVTTEVCMTSRTLGVIRQRPLTDGSKRINIILFNEKDRYYSSNQNLITRVQELASAKEVWFRAAVIAVPIAGGLILVLLIMLALRMLRSENKRLQAQRQQMLSRLHYSFHGHHHAKKGHVAKLDLECMVPVTGHENCCLGCDKLRQTELCTGGGSGGERLLSLVHWGMYTGHGKLEFV
ncbi:BMP and activin membrane-bound inhibitor-like protein [Labeo rohita]|uniref:BMP and activin membrane-bound inhibitor-like protein n=1 Tax=Labeo rohita TaxID=84645 RepID=A0A498LU66_LABRO|nr:BMP and activin membrane-bound inhibitor-like protein [Labeo rohita]RXN11163.1 BMP and activin membrane-bound inhibitor-like protein [Labeo rohita]